MVKLAELEGHSSRVLHLAQSPDGTTIVSAAADETLRCMHHGVSSTAALAIVIAFQHHTDQ